MKNLDNESNSFTNEEFAKGLNRSIGLGIILGIIIFIYLAFQIAK